MIRLLQIVEEISTHVERLTLLRSQSDAALSARELARARVTLTRGSFDNIPHWLPPDGDWCYGG